MTLLLVSLVALFVGPVTYPLAAKYTKVHKHFEKVIVLVLGVLVVFHIMPDAYAVGGPWVIALAIVGLLLPSLLERAWKRLEHQVHVFPLLIGTIGLALHAAIDGAAFVDVSQHMHFEKGNHHHAMLPWAVILHRVPVGMFLWWSQYPKTGYRFPLLILLFISVMTLVGYQVGGMYFHQLESDATIAYFQAVVAGSLLHLAIDRHSH